MRQERAAVFHRVRETCNFDYEKGFWDRPCEKSTPGSLLLDRAMARAVREKVELLLFQRVGLLEDSSAPGSTPSLEALNAARAANEAAGVPTFGPLPYSKLQYRGHWMARTRIAATERLVERGFITPTEMGSSDQGYEAYVDRLVSEALVETDVEALRRIVRRAQWGEE
jgi:hypothetical protein